jgi:hypothetical protein
MERVSKNEKRAVLIGCLLVIVVFLLMSRIGKGLFVTVYFFNNYNTSEYYILDRFYYESRRDSDITDRLDSIGIEFPSVVFRIRSYNNPDRIFYIGMHEYSIWDTYYTDVIEREAVDGVEQRIGLLINEALNHETMFHNAYIRIAPRNAEESYDIAKLTDFDTGLFVDLPFRMRIIVFETGFLLKNEGDARKSVMGWLNQLNENNMEFDYVSIYFGNKSKPFRRYIIDYENTTLVETD